jgi:hypothetical protein
MISKQVLSLACKLLRALPNAFVRQGIVCLLAIIAALLTPVAADWVFRSAHARLGRSWPDPVQERTGIRLAGIAAREKSDGCSLLTQRHIRLSQD